MAPGHDGLLVVGPAAAPARPRNRDRLPGPADPRRADGDVPLDIAFRTMRALRSADVQLTVIKGGGHRLSEPHEIDAILRTVAGLLEPALDPSSLPPLAAAAPAAASRACPERPRPKRSSAARSSPQQERRFPKPPRQRRSSKRPRPHPTRIPRPRACGPRPAICGSPPASRARPRSRSTRRWPARPRGRAARRSLLDRARAAEAQNDLKTARAKVNEAAATISDDPFYWYFSAALAIREEGQGRPPSRRSAGADARPGRPDDPVRSRPRRHFAGDDAGARDYWTRRRRRPKGPIGKAAREALRCSTCRSPSRPTPPNGDRTKTCPASRGRSRSSSRRGPSGTASCRPTSRSPRNPRRRARRPRNSPGWRS
jgi:hypothetical protein